jgi:hypothetical protein
MSLGLAGPTKRYSDSASLNEAVNDAQFVRTFGIICLVGSLLTFVSGAVAIGLGMAVLGFGHSRFFKVLGGAVIGLGVASIFVKFLGVVGALALSAGVIWKATRVLGVLSREGHDDPDWPKAQLRGMVGLVTSCLGALISVLWAAFIVLTLVLQSTGEIP